MRFAAKEAIVKALGTGFAHGIWIRDVGIVPNAWGRPEVIWSERGRALARQARRRRGTRHAHGRGGSRGGRRRADEARGAIAMSIINNVFAFDIETVPDVEFGRRLHGLETLTDKQVGYVMQTRQREQTGNEFLSLEQQRIVAISIAMRSRDGFKVWSLGEPDSPRRSWCAASSTASSASRRRWSAGTARIRPAGAALPRAAPQGPGPSLLGDGRHGPVVQVEQLHQPLPLAARRPHGRARGVPGPRPRRPRPDVAAARLPRQTRHVGRGRLGRAPPGSQRGHPQLLRDRRRQHVPDLSALRADARPPDARGARARGRARARGAAGARTSRTCANTWTRGRSAGADRP